MRFKTVASLRAGLQEHTALRVGVYGIAGIAFLFVFFLISMGVVHYTESTAFCSSCHAVMNPEVTTHRVSAHAHTDCGTCHIGPGVWPKVQAKLENVRYLWSYPLKLYETPIPSPLNTMRPARETCEQCHWPAKFYPLRLATLYDYAEDESNSLTRTLLMVKVGGGEGDPEGQGPGVHWHIQNPVYYIATDEQRQDISWVQVEIAGKVTEYISTDANLTQEEIDQANKRRMDCMDCHNRATHIIQRPAEAIDQAMSTGDIPADLPFIKRQGVAALEKKYSSKEEAMAELGAITDFYRTEYPDVYANRQADVTKAVESLQQIYERTRFPFMNAYWDSYPNNVGHKDFPGCFRCHDGKHLSANNQVIRLECNMCHSIPQVAEPGMPLPEISLAVKEAPESHHSTLWLAEHRYQFDTSCVACHTVENPGGSDNSSFCSNSACHGRAWEFVGLNAPEIHELVAPPRLPSAGEPAPIPHPIGPDTDCRLCHGLDKPLSFPENHAGYNVEICTSCHRPVSSEVAPTPEPSLTPEPPPEASPTPARTPPPIPHELGGREDCLLCHDPDGNIKPAPSDHKGRPVEVCQTCHQPASLEVPQTPGVTTSPAATSPASGIAPAIPHDLEERVNCLACHDPDGNVRPAPGDHKGRPVEVCQSCHRPGEEEED